LFIDLDTNHSFFIASSGVMGANYYNDDDEDDEDDEDYVPSMGRNKYDDSDYDEASFNFDADVVIM
jgi:hypothetical protein